MKKWMILVMLATVVLSLVAAPTTGHTRGWGWHGGWGWWVPGAIVGGVALGAALTYPYWAYPYPYAYGYPYPAPPYPYASNPYGSYAYAPPPQVQAYAEPQQEYWYYCKDAHGYYPYVASCPSGWVRMLPTPPPPGREGER